jgi:hypothetical protein
LNPSPTRRVLVRPLPGGEVKALRADTVSRRPEVQAHLPTLMK